MKKECERLTIRAGRFQTGVDTLDALLCQPLTQLRETCRIVSEDFMLELTAIIDETDVELEFCNVDAERRFCHDEFLLDKLLRRRSNLQMQAQLLEKRLRILSDLNALQCKYRELV